MSDDKSENREPDAILSFYTLWAKGDVCKLSMQLREQQNKLKETA